MGDIPCNTYTQMYVHLHFHNEYHHPFVDNPRINSSVICGSSQGGKEVEFLIVDLHTNLFPVAYDYLLFCQSRDKAENDRCIGVGK